MKVVLKNEAGSSVEVSEGADYHRAFNKKDEPFEISGKEINILFGTGLFEEAIGHRDTEAQSGH